MNGQNVVILGGHRPLKPAEVCDLGGFVSAEPSTESVVVFGRRPLQSAERTIVSGSMGGNPVGTLRKVSIDLSKGHCSAVHITGNHSFAELFSSAESPARLSQLVAALKTEYGIA